MAVTRVGRTSRCFMRNTITVFFLFIGQITTLARSAISFITFFFIVYLNWIERLII